MWSPWKESAVRVEQEDTRVKAALDWRDTKIPPQAAFRPWKVGGSVMATPSDFLEERVPGECCWGDAA